MVLRPHFSLSLSRPLRFVESAALANMPAQRWSTNFVATSTGPGPDQRCRPGLRPEWRGYITESDPSPGDLHESSMRLDAQQRDTLTVRRRNESGGVQRPGGSLAVLWRANLGNCDRSQNEGGLQADPSFATPNTTNLYAPPLFGLKGRPYGSTSQPSISRSGDAAPNEKYKR